ncbi:MAG: VWA domain-containing protein [Planctomycetes bacterium]|nr:VWA domain-containing protein [Planctomycetota bacterium]
MNWSEVNWNNAPAFWLAWVLPLLVASAVFAHRGVARAAERFAGRTMTPRLLPPLHASAAAAKAAWFLGGVMLAIVAAASPGWGVVYRPVAAHGLDLVVALDVSRSMLADDAGDSRLGRARSAIAWLVDALEGDRVGLLLFAGQTVQTCPLTLDRGFFRGALADANPALVGRGGTKLGPALDEALRMLDTSHDRDKLVLLVTDGGDQESFPKAAAERLAEKGVRVIALGLGRADEGAPLVIEGKIVRTQDGQPVSARLNDALMKELATSTKGMYVPPDAAHRLPDLYAEHFGALRRGKHEEMQEKLHREQYQWFLVPGFVLLLVQAGRSPYRRRRAANETTSRTAAPRAGAKSAIALLVLAGLVTACSREADQVEIALEQFRAGEYEKAETTLLALGDERKDRPLLAYDLACVHQARGRASEARARYVDALDRGEKQLRARTHHNLAMLGVERLRALAGDDVAAVKKDKREEIQALAGAALDDLLRARQLDPSLDAPSLDGDAGGEVTRRQDKLARWLRATEDAWRERDRQTERDARAAEKGSAYLAALIDGERDLLARLAQGEALEDLELRQRDLRDDLGRCGEHFADEGAALPEAFRAEASAGLVALDPELRSVESALRDGATDVAATSIRAAADAMTGVLALWAAPDATLLSAARAQQDFVQELQQHTRLRAAAVDGGAEALSVVERMKDELIARERRIASWLVNLARRLAPEHAAAEGSSVFVERARARLPEIDALLARTAERVGGTGPQALVLGTRAAQALDSLALEAQISGLDAKALVQRLELEQQRLVRAADVLLDPTATPRGVLATLNRVARDVALALAWQPLPSDARDQAGRAVYLEPAIEKRRAAAQQGHGAEQHEQDRKPEAEQAALAVAVARARDALERASSACGATPSEAAVVALHEARVALRGLGILLGDFDGLLERAANEQASLAAQGEADAKDEALLAHRDALREQGLTTPAIEALRDALAGEITTAQVQADEKTATADDAEKAERRAALEALGKSLTPAAEAARDALGALGTPAETREAANERRAAAAPAQRRAADLLRAAVDELARARLPLVELGKRIAEGEANLLELARSPDAAHPRAELEASQRDLGSFVVRLGPALARQFARPGKESGEEPREETEDEKAAKAQLEALVTAIGPAHAASLEALRGADATHDAASIEAVLDPSRDLWSVLAEFQPLLERAVAESAERLARSQGFAQTAPDDARAQHAAVDQLRTRRFVPELRAKIEAIAAQQQAQQEQQQQQAQQPGQAQPAAPGGLSPELIELARKNLPAAEAAMDAAQAQITGRAWRDVVDRQDEAHRLLEEILEKLQKDQKDQQDQQDQQQQPQPQDQQQTPQQPRSPEELERLMQAVRERNRNAPQPTARSTVKEDW